MKKLFALPKIALACLFRFVKSVVGTAPLVDSPAPRARIAPKPAKNFAEMSVDRKAQAEWNRTVDAVKAHYGRWSPARHAEFVAASK